MLTNRRSLATAVFVLLAALPARAEWESIGPGVDYRLYEVGNLVAHVAKVDLTSDEIRIVVSTEEDRGLRVSRFAEKRNAIVAINGDYFTEQMEPIGLVIGACGRWEGTKDTTREGVVAFGDRQVEIFTPAEVNEPAAEWVEQAISGWPMVVRNCEAIAAAELPGSDRFTRAPHPRTAVGFSKSEDLMYLVVVEGRREGVPGATLAELGSFMRETLEVCNAMNLDGGGSSAMAVAGKVVNWTSDGKERRVVNHLAVVPADAFPKCEAAQPLPAEAEKPVEEPAP